MTPDAYRAALARLGISQGELAAILQTDTGTVSRWARGIQRVPRAVELLLRLERSDLERIAA